MEGTSFKSKYEHGPFPTCAFIGYIFISAFCLIVYMISYICFFKN